MTGGPSAAREPGIMVSARLPRLFTFRTVGVSFAEERERAS